MKFISVSGYALGTEFYEKTLSVLPLIYFFDHFYPEIRLQKVKSIFEK